MATTPDAAPAAADDARAATVFGTTQRGDQHHPDLQLTGEAPKKGANLRVRLENGVVYRAKAVAVTSVDGAHLVETEGLTPEGPAS